MQRPAMIDLETLQANWGVAVRTAVVSACLVAAFALALQWYLGVGTAPLVAGAAVIGLIVGLMLPPAIPPRRSSRSAR